MSFTNDMLSIAMNESTGGLMNIVQSDDELIQEFKQDVKAHYANRRAAELNSNKAGHSNRANYDSSRDKYNIAGKAPENTETKVRHDFYKNKANEANKNAAKSKWDSEYSTNKANDEITRHKLNRNELAETEYRKPTNKHMINMPINKNDRKREAKLAKEAVEEWYAENGITLNDYEAGCVDMFVRELMSE